MRINCLRVNCKDACCQWGADIDLKESLAILESDIPCKHSRESWFDCQIVEDPEFPSGFSRRINAVNGYCIFKNLKGRGCLIYRQRPTACKLFPMEFSNSGIVKSEDCGICSQGNRA